jgi:hypothetical protein
MKTNIKKKSRKLKNNILVEIKFDPSVKATDIGVLVKDGTEWWYQKTATGNVLHYPTSITN